MPFAQPGQNEGGVNGPAGPDVRKNEAMKRMGLVTVIHEGQHGTRTRAPRDVSVGSMFLLLQLHVMMMMITIMKIFFYVFDIHSISHYSF